MKTRILSSCILLFAVAACQQIESTARADISFNVAPAAVSNTFNGAITLQIGGLTNGETVVVQKFLDVNTNGVTDAADWLVQQFQLTDGQAGMVIGGIVNSNVPGDTDMTAGQITARLNFRSGDFIQNIAGQYVFKLSSPGGHFAPITTLFSVTNAPYAQKFTGNVLSNSTSTTLPNAVVLLFGPPRAGGKGPGGPALAGAVANNSGGYTIPAPPGAYSPIAFKNGYVANFAAPPVITLASGQTVTTNLMVTNATSSISGTLVDAGNSGITLPGVLLPVKSKSGLLAITFTDTNGAFNAPVTAGMWQIKADDTGLIVHGYLGSQNGCTTNAGATGVTVTAPKATALFYGSVKDSLGNPLPGIDVYANDNGSLYESDGYTDANGNYSAAALGGLGIYDTWSLQIGSHNCPTNYVFSQQAFLQYGGTNVAADTAVSADFTALLATNHITGSLQDDRGNPIAGVGVWAGAEINGVGYLPGSVDTDANGNYWLNVVNGAWGVGINGGYYYSGSGDRLPGNYLCPPSQSVVISNNNGTVNFTALSGTNTITGSLKDDSGNPITGVGVSADATINGDYYHQGTVDTDANGNYSLNVVSGVWWVYLNSGAGPDSLPGNYICPSGESVVISTNNGTASFIAPAATNRITGSVKDSNGNPIAGIQVSAYAKINGVDYNQGGLSTDTNGDYSMNVANGTWTVSVYLPGNYLQSESQSVLISNNNATVNFTALTPVNYISGTIKDNNGNPIANAGVWAGATINGVDCTQSGPGTDTNGYYSLKVVNGTWKVSVGLPGNYLQPTSRSVVIANNNGTVNFTTRLTTSYITGSLKDVNGNPIGNVGVWANATIDGTDYSQYVHTDSDGNYSLEVANGAWWVGLNLDNYVCTSQQSVVISNNTGTVNFIALSATHCITGSLKDNLGNPIVGVGVLANGTINGVDYFQHADTDGSGNYSMLVANGTWSISLNNGAFGDILPGDYICPPSQTVVISNNTGTASFIALFATHYITGSLKDNSGNPIAGVGIWASATINGVNYYQGNADTDTNGNYSMAVANGTWALSVNTGGGSSDRLPGNYVCAQQLTVVIANNNGVVNFIALPATHRISGSLKDTIGNPFIGVGVFASAILNNLDYFQPVETDTNGNYSMYVANGVWNVFVNTGGGGDSLPVNYVCSVPQTVVISNNTGTANFTALLAPNHITGRVRQANGDPISGLGMWATATINSVNYQQNANTDANGNYSMNVANGSWMAGLACGSGGGVGLDDILGAGSYQCPANQPASILNNNAVLNFTVQPIVPSGPDLLDYYVLKLAAFQQVDSVNFVPDNNFGPFHAYLGVVQSTPDVIAFADVTLPTDLQKYLPWDDRSLELQNQESFPDQASLDAAYPPGEYDFRIYALHDDLQFPVLTMPPAAYPNPPHVSNFAAAQSINPLSPFTLQWDAIPGATSNDSFWVIVTDADGNWVFSTPKPSTDRVRALPGTATSVTIPANTFQPGYAYRGWIVFDRTTSVDLSQYPGVAGITVIAAQTSVRLTPASASARPRLDQPARLSSTQFQFQLSGLVGQNYTVQVSTNLASSSWSTLLITNLPVSPVLIEDNQATDKRRFYRVEVGP